VFVQSFVLMVGGFIAPVIRRIPPRAALLVAGRHLDHLHRHAAGRADGDDAGDRAGLLRRHHDRLVRRRALLQGRTRGLVAIVVGRPSPGASTILGFDYGGLTLAGLKAAVSSFGFSYPMPASATCSRLRVHRHHPGHAIPFGIYDLVEAMDNVESAAAAGDRFPTTRVLTADGVVSLIGCLMGNPFINASTSAIPAGRRWAAASATRPRPASW
jgi:AGZA family xanthine/uracil permease-like MFS transporter